MFALIYTSHDTARRCGPSWVPFLSCGPALGTSAAESVESLQLLGRWVLFVAGVGGWKNTFQIFRQLDLVAGSDDTKLNPENRA